MEYKFKYKRRLLWVTRTVIGHNYLAETDKMVLYFPDGTIEEIPAWKTCALRLGLDWKEAMRRQMEADSGQTVTLSVKDK